jgi:copper resistance protein C
MKERRQWLVRWMAALAALMVLLAAGKFAEGHAVLKSSSPAANATVTGSDVPIVLKFNVRIDAGRSKVQLLHPDSTQTDLVLNKQTEPDTLTSKATGLTPGNYTIRWQVLAPDGHITRGEVPFAVKAG